MRNTKRSSSRYQNASHILRSSKESLILAVGSASWCQLAKATTLVRYQMPVFESSNVVGHGSAEFLTGSSCTIACHFCLAVNNYYYTPRRIYAWYARALLCHIDRQKGFLSHRHIVLEHFHGLMSWIDGKSSYNDY